MYYVYLHDDKGREFEIEVVYRRGTPTVHWSGQVYPGDAADIKVIGGNVEVKIEYKGKKRSKFIELTRRYIENKFSYDEIWDKLEKELETYEYCDY